MLRGLPSTQDERLLVGHGTFDDAGVFALDEERALVQTVDFFPPVTNDPYGFGQVAAANSLSDVFAMGGEPLTALGIVAFPLGELPLEDLTAIMRGGGEKVAEAGAQVVGGHSVNETEIKFGLAVTGMVHPKRITSNANAKPGDKLFLTKPLGMGAVTTAYRLNKIAGDHMQRAIDLMATLNKGARDAMHAVGINEPGGVHAATDVTGYGLLGHARNMAEGSGVTLAFRAEAVPCFEGALDFARRKMQSRAMKENEKLLGEMLEADAGLEDGIRRVIFDAETSGGLLIAVAPDGADQLARELADRGVPCVAEVGEVLARGPRALKIS